MVSVIVNLVDWLKDWFYVKSDVDSMVSHKQDTLVSSENIKTINNQSLLGSCNITIQGGGGSDHLVCVDDFYYDDVDEDLTLEVCGDGFVVTEWEQTLSDTKVASEKLTKDSIDMKQDVLVSGTSIKTINNESLLGSGNISIQGGGSVIGTGSFSIDNNGHLIVELPTGVVNPYSINSQGHLIYDTSASGD